MNRDGDKSFACAGLDRDRMLANMGGDEDLLREVIEIFLRECPRLLEGIEAAVESDDPERLEMVAHSLKGSAGVFSAEDVYASAERLEVMGRDGDLTGARPVLDSLIDEMVHLRGALVDLCHHCGC